jgi:hypothetical protein
MKLARLATAAVLALAAVGCKDKKSTTGPGTGNTVTLSGSAATDFSNKLSAILAPMLPSGIQSTGPVGTAIMLLTGNRVSRVTVNSDLGAALSSASLRTEGGPSLQTVTSEGYDAIGIGVEFLNAPAGVIDPPYGIVALKPNAQGLDWRNYVVVVANDPIGTFGQATLTGTVGGTSANALGQMGILAGTAPNFPGSQIWSVVSGGFTLGTGVSASTCNNLTIVQAVLGAGMSCQLWFLNGTSLNNLTGTPFSSNATGTRTASFASQAVIAIKIIIDCAVSNLC